MWYLQTPICNGASLARHQWSGQRLILSVRAGTPSNSSLLTWSRSHLLTTLSFPHRTYPFFRSTTLLNSPFPSPLPHLQNDILIFSHHHCTIFPFLCDWKTVPYIHVTHTGSHISLHPTLFWVFIPFASPHILQTSSLAYTILTIVARAVSSIIASFSHPLS